MGTILRLATSFVALWVGSRLLLACTPVSADAFYTRTTTTSGSTAPVEPTPTHYTGPVRMFVTAAAVAPATDSGSLWDGTGSVPERVRQNLRDGLTPAIRRSLLARMTNPAAAVAATVAGELLPWVADVVNDATSPPDVRLNISLNGQWISATEQIENTFYPSWSGCVGPITFRSNDVLAITAVDDDLMVNDHIGTCTLLGVPTVDDRGYIVAESMECSGQLWAVAVRLVPVVPGDEEQIRRCGAPYTGR